MNHSRRVAEMAVVAAFFVTVPAGAQPQPERTKPDAAKTAGEVLDEALRKIDVGDFNDALLLLQRAKKAAPSLEKILLVEGLLLAEARKFAEATANLEQYNRTDKGKVDYRGYAEVGKVYRMSKLYRLAQRPLEQAKQFAPDQVGGRPIRARIALDLAECYFSLGKQKRALDTIEEAEREAPNDPDIQRMLADIALKMKDHARSFKAIDKSIDMFNTKARSSPFNYEQTQSLKSCLELKIKIARDQIATDPRNVNSYLALSEAMHDLGEILQRIQTLQARDVAMQGAAKDAKNYKLAVYLAFLEADLGGLAEALDRLNEVIANDPQNQRALSLRDEIQGKLNKPQTP